MPAAVSEPIAAAPAPLLQRVARGDASAVRACIERYGGLVWSLARRFTPGNAPNDAEDAVQEIFVDLWRSAVRYDPAVASETTFVAMIARRRLIDRLRRNRRQQGEAVMRELDEAAEAALSSQQAVAPDRSAEAALATRALGTLRPEQRQVLLLATCHGLSHDEISRHTGMPLGTVKAHARRGLQRIRSTLLGQPERDADDPGLAAAPPALPGEEAR